MFRTALRLATPRLSAVSARAAAPRLARAAIPSARGFALSAPRLGSGETDAELSSRLAQEISYEQEQSPSASSPPAFVRDFAAAGVWRIADVPGSDEIALTRSYGNENIRVLFSIGDIDSAAAEHEMEGEEEGNEEDEEAAGFPVRCAITISKPGQGSLTVDAQAHDGEFAIENISFYRDEKLATELTAEADWSRRGLYIGPQFETLDESVQAQFEAYLTERGIDSDLARFVPDFAELKEQREYCAWLENVKTFIDA